AQDRPVLHVFNKVDRLERPELLALQERVHNLLPNSVFVSATAPGGLEPLRRALVTAVRASRPITELLVPLTNGKLLAEVHRAAEVLGQRSDGEHIVVSARLDAATLGRLQQHGAVVHQG
ncbi:MAG: GTPase HflX, partial [Gemmatimonadaceae bacterium]